MKQFAQLIQTLDSTNKTNAKIAALAAYFQTATPEDKVWTIAILSHRRPSRPVQTKQLRAWAAAIAQIPLWLFEESYHIVGDLAETIALVLPPPTTQTTKTLTYFLNEFIALKPADDTTKKEYVTDNWQALDYYERFVFTKLITGGFRIGVSQKLMTRALAQATTIDEDILAYKLMGNWDPATISFQELVVEEKASDFLSKPYPFYLAYAVEGAVAALGEVTAWSIEHKWDGIRAQIIIRDQQVFVWSRGEELVTAQYPEFYHFATQVPDGTVLDGEILPFAEGSIGSFNDLQKRIGRKKVSKALLQKTPVILKAYDLLEWQGQDIRNQPYHQRRTKLEAIHAQYTSQLERPTESTLHLSTAYHFDSWEAVAAERDKAREMKSEGLMLKNKEATYKIGRKKGDWWKWKVAPLTIDAVLTYAMRGHGRRSNLFTDYTFALWDADGNLVTFAKAYSGLTDAEFKQVDAWIKKNTVERFGPVRSVTPTLVFEIAFEGIALSKRHKSGVATRFPRILRWRKDKQIAAANTLEDLKAMIPN